MLWRELLSGINLVVVAIVLWTVYLGRVIDSLLATDP